jgi:DNA-binding NarL/FixJ family response regulator
MAPLRELGCLAPLLKPVDPMVLAETIRRALKTTPPPLAPGQGVLLWAQEQAARQEYVGRTMPPLQVIVCAATGIIQRGLQDLVERAGARVVARTSYPRNILSLLDTPSDCTAVVATCPDLVDLVPLAQSSRLPLACVVSNLAEGLTAMEWRDAAQIPFGIVVEHSDEQQTIVLMDRTLRCLAQGESVFPAALREPFAALRLSEQEQILLGADVRGLPANDVANRLSIDQPTLRQRRKRLREKLHVPDQQSLAVWATTWWQKNMSI